MLQAFGPTGQAGARRGPCRAIDHDRFRSKSARRRFTDDDKATASRLVALAKARTPAVVRAESEKIEAVTPRSRRSERTRLCATLRRGESAKHESERLFREESTRRGAEAKARVIAGRAAERLVASSSTNGCQVEAVNSAESQVHPGHEQQEVSGELSWDRIDLLRRPAQLFSRQFPAIQTPD
jgi:hypothetical protein